ncbi:hypothetical protein WA026_018330 [Henosepilachna vigintioctopunctata]|uniref:A-kinase anchor protein n=1 Tax=Henosepilachna vigintioctopunctata TaxID=420089 RepID=A0AAW1VFQ5_9CUCU
MDSESAGAADSQRKSQSSSQKRISDQLNEEDILLMGLQRVVDSTSDKMSDVGYITDDNHEQFEGQLSLNEDITFKTQTLCQKLECMSYNDIDVFAEELVDEIIDVSVGICEHIATILDGKIEEIEIKEHIIPKIEDNITKALGKISVFQRLPQLEEFTLDLGITVAEQIMSQWITTEDWEYAISYVASWSDRVSDFHLFKAMWSIPTKEYPIPQATATIFFTIEVPRVKPKFCRVDVTIQFEGSSSIYKAGQFEFMEQWLFNIIDSKLNLFKTLKF